MVLERPLTDYYVYIMTNESRMLYVGVTNDLQRRVFKHQQKLDRASFTAKYNMTRLAYFESTSDIRAAIAREKQLKGWLRKRKVGFVESVNPLWEDLSDAWSEDEN